MTSNADYHCPICGTLSELVIGPTQAFCTNKTGCKVLMWNPSLPDGGLSDAEFVDLSAFAGESCNDLPDKVRDTTESTLKEFQLRKVRRARRKEES